MTFFTIRAYRSYWKPFEIELISRHHDNYLAGPFGIEKTCKLVAQKYYWPTFRHNVEACVKSCNICLTSKIVRHNSYGILQSLPVPMHRWKDLLMDFLTGLSISINWKRDNYNSILVIINWLTKMVYYKPTKIILDVPGFLKIIINIAVYHHKLLDLIVTNRGSFFTSKFWSSLCYFFGFKRRLSITFYLQTDSQTEQ